MHDRHCPLCGGAALSLQENIPSEQLAAVYRKETGLDVAGHFEGVPALACLACDACSLRFFDPPVTGNAAFYQGLMANGWYYAAEKWEFAEAAACLRSGDRVLEIGCGRGLWADTLPGIDYTGLETSAAAIALAGAPDRLRRQTVEEHAKTHAAAYDMVCAFQVLEHVADPAAFLGAAVSCLRPGGALLLSTPSPDGYGGMVVNYALDLPPHHVTRWPDAVWPRLEGLFPLRLERLAHEPLQDCHMEHYCQTMAVALARHRLGLPGLPLVDCSPGHQQAVQAAKELAGAVRAVLADPRVRPARGHTVLAVYRKAGRP